MEKNKKATIAALDQMIAHADKGPSGFWTSDYEGCGNPAIFPEFEDGLKRGKLVQKQHSLCPWNTSVLYGADHGNLSTGCFYSCSIDRARYLNTQELRRILTRFKIRLQNGTYDHADHVFPLLTEDERVQIETRRQAKELAERRRKECEQQSRRKKAAGLIRKYPDQESLLAEYYGKDNVVTTEDGVLFFSPDSRAEVEGAKELSYDEYLDIQFTSLRQKYRTGFTHVFFNIPMEFKGQIEKIRPKYVCFKRIFISGMYPDGEMFEGKEDHVWMEKSGFEGFCVGDSLLFHAEVYRYVKTGHGKQIDYGLRNPSGIQKVPDYMLPSDDELMMQTVGQIICETCFLSEFCDRVFCMRNQKEKQLLERHMFQVMKDRTDEETKR